MVAYLLPAARQSFETATGSPAAGWKLYTYAAGTNTPQLTWSDSAQTAQNTNPIILDGRGEASVFFSGSYKLVLKDQNDVTIWTQDSVEAPPASIYTNAIYSALAAASGSGLLGFQASATGAVQRTALDKMRDGVSVKDFGAVGNNVNDDTGAIQAAINRGGRIVFPNGTYRITSPLTINNQVNLVGDAGSVVLVASFAAGDVMNITYTNNAGPATSIDGIEFSSSVARTSGAYLSLTGDPWFVYVDRCRFNAGYNGIVYAGTGVGGFYVRECVVLNSANYGVLYGASSSNNGGGNGFDLVLENTIIIGPSEGANSVAGVKITSAGDISLKHVSTIHCAKGLWVAPGPNRRVQLMMVENSFFDSGSDWGIYCATNGGRVDCLKLSDCWSATNGNGGCYIGTNSTGDINQVDLVNTVLSNNATQGLRISSNAKNVSVINCSMGSNKSDGILVDPGTNAFKIIGCTAGPSGEFGPNGGYGINIKAGPTNGYIVSLNFAVNNTLGTIYDGGTGGAKVVANNIA